MTSGQLPWIAGELKFKGKIGADLTPEEGYQAFRLSALNAISQLKSTLGSLDRIKQVVRLEGTMGCARASPHSLRCLTAPPMSSTRSSVLASRHTRMIYSNNEMPLDCATLVVLYAEIVPAQ